MLAQNLQIILMSLQVMELEIGTNNANTDTTNSSAKTLPNKRKLKDNGLVKSSRILIGNKIGVG